MIEVYDSWLAYCPLDNFSNHLSIDWWHPKSLVVPFMECHPVILFKPENVSFRFYSITLDCSVAIQDFPQPVRLIKFSSSWKCVRHSWLPNSKNSKYRWCAITMLRKIYREILLGFVFQSVEIHKYYCTRAIFGF